MASTLRQRAYTILRRLAAQSSSDVWRTRVKTIIARKPAPGPYELTTERGHTLDQLTNYALYAMEKRLGYKPGSLTVIQGSYNRGGVAKSAGTHDGGGAVDLSPDNWQEKLRVGKKVGFAIWHRPPNWDGVGGSEHLHAELIGNAKLSASAQDQVAQYKAGLNGLANRGRDANPWRPSPIPVFRMPKYARQ